MELAEAVRILKGNPFAVDGADWRRAERRLRELPVAEVLSDLVRRGEVEEATRTALAAGHSAACRSPDDPSNVLGEDVLPAKIVRALPRTRGAYLRTVMAAARCRHALDRVLGSSAAAHRVRRETWAACFGDSLLHALRLAQVIHDHDVLILGETGTGKEAVAQAIQDGTPGTDDGKPAPRSALNAAAVPETLIESELFGHVKGAFTGATDSRVGRIRSAHAGSFFLDEVGDLQATTQVKLLRVIETNEVTPLGSDSHHHADVRYVSATHKDLARMVEEGRYRRDLYERLAGNVIRLPALRNRPEDVVEIGTAFVERHLPAGALELTRARIDAWVRSEEALGYGWPGNVRELQNALRNLMLGLAPGIGVAHPRASQPDLESLPESIRDCEAPLAHVEDWYFARVLAHVDGNLTKAGAILGVDRTTVRRRARKLSRPR
jgi:transcriptional regulator with PAS, ATPase and Fis domain